MNTLKILATTITKENYKGIESEAATLVDDMIRSLSINELNLENIAKDLKQKVANICSNVAHAVTALEERRLFSEDHVSGFTGVLARLEFPIQEANNFLMIFEEKQKFISSLQSDELTSEKFEALNPEKLTTYGCFEVKAEVVELYEGYAKKITELDAQIMQLRDKVASSFKKEALSRDITLLQLRFDSIFSHAPLEKLDNEWDNRPSFQSYLISASKLLKEIDTPENNTILEEADRDLLSKLKVSFNEWGGFEAKWDALENVRIQLAGIKEKSQSQKLADYVSTQDARTLYQNVYSEMEAYTKGKISISQFKERSQIAIDTAKKSSLKDHRGCKEWVRNLAYAIGTLGVGYLVTALILQRKKVFQPETDSIKKTKDLEKAVEAYSSPSPTQ